MKAFVMRSYGSPVQLALADVPQPVPAEDEVLVRVRATSVNPYDWHHLRGEPIVARLMGGMNPRHPKYAVLGADVAGQVEAVGAAVTAFQPGDAVYALLEQGGFGEYVCVPESGLTPMPKNLSFEEAAAVPLAGCTALLAVRDDGRLQPGQKVLVNGASGGVGTFAVQIAKALGASVTGVCGPRNTGLVRSIGADQVIDYSTQDFTAAGPEYDLVIDIAGSRSAAACRRVLKRDGTYAVVGGKAGRWVQPVGHMFGMLAVAPFASQRMTGVDLVRCKENMRNLATLTGLIDTGKVKPVIDRSYPFAEIPAAVTYQEGGHAAGKVVVTY